MNKIPSPEEFFGIRPGSDRTMLRWDRLCEYYFLLESLSDRIKIEVMGKSSEGNDFLIAYVSSPVNLKNIEYYRDISMKLSDPRELSQKEIDEYTEKGKVFCFQSYGLHSNEVGGPQCVPILLYDLITGKDGIDRVLDDVIFIVSPCSEPDGEIVFTDWYNKYLGTPFEGIVSPYLRHNWGGHSNNRDALREVLVESRYLNDIIIRRFMPQLFQDHHHQDPWMERMSIAPCDDPIYEYTSPFVQRQTQLCGASMAMELLKAGRKGIVSRDRFYNDYPLPTFYGVACLHNVVGMLTESADVNIATPLYFTPDKFRGTKEITASCPEPWQGGEWHLYDIVEQIYIASVALLKYAADNRKELLSLTVTKARAQAERGKRSDKKAYIIPRDQHDPSAVDLLLSLLKNHNITMNKISNNVVVGGKMYPAGTVVVPLDQPKYAVVETFLGKSVAKPKPYAPCDKRPVFTDTANLSFTMCMGVKAIPAMEEIDKKYLVPYEKEEPQYLSFPMSGRINACYKRANELLAKGEVLFRNDNGDFCLDGGQKIRRSRVGLMKKSATWNEEEGYTRSLLRMYDFDYRIVLDKEIRETGVPCDIDVLIIPGDTSGELRLGDVAPADKPPEHHSGLGKAGGTALREFVKHGGRLIAWEKSCDYVIGTFGFKIGDRSSSVHETEYGTFGSQIYIDLEKDILCRGMPTDGVSVTHTNGPIFVPGDENCEVIARVAKSDICANGIVVGEQQLAGTPCILRIRYGKGEVLLYSFNPEFRCQQDGSFKLLFNALYESE